MGDFLIGVLASSGVFVVLGIYVYMNPEKLEKWVAMGLNLVGFVTDRFYRKQIKYDIQSSINSFVKRLAQDSHIENVGVKVKWAGGKDQADDVRWKDGEVVLVMKDRGQRNRNFVHAAYLFASTSLLKNVKTHLSKKQSTAIDLFTTGKILEEESPPALDYFVSDIANPLLEDDKIKGFVEQFEDIDKAGYYVNILLQELHYLGTKVVFNQRRGEVYDEVGRLIAFLRQFAMREVGDDTIPEEFIGHFLRTSIKIVSTAQVRESGRTHGPSERICRAFEKGIENVYVVGPHFDNGREFIDMVCEAVKVKAPHVAVVRNRTFKGAITLDGETKRTSTYMAQIQNRSGRKFIDTKDAYKTIEEYRQEVASLNTDEEA
ncbi:MAG: hypothetical protein AAB834_05330 [Patescibacteria group bacterium]